MTPMLLDRIRKFQEHVWDLRLSRSVLALPAPRTLMLAAPSNETSSAIYEKTITADEIERVSRDLFASGHFSLAVAESFKAVEKYVQYRAKEQGLSGAKLMQRVFSSDCPRLFWSDRNSTSEEDEQKGYLMLYVGAMLGIRNPVTHEFNWVDDEYVALELILFAQHLLRKAKLAKHMPIPEGGNNA